MCVVHSVSRSWVKCGHAVPQSIEVHMLWDRKTHKLGGKTNFAKHLRAILPASSKNDLCQFMYSVIQQLPYYNLRLNTS